MSTNNPLPLPADLLRFVLQQTVYKRVGEHLQASRGDLFERLADTLAQVGSDRFTVTLLGSGRKVGTVSIVQPKPQEVRDDAAMLEWAREHRPDWVKTIEHPAMPAWTEERVDWARVLDGVQDTEAGVVTDDGEPVEGLSYRPVPPKAFTVRLATGGGDALIDAWKAGELAHLELGGALPAIEPPAADTADTNNDEEN